MHTVNSIIPIANRCGWTSDIPNPMTCRFLELIRGLNDPIVIDIGAGYGVASIPATELGPQSLLMT